VGVSYDSNSGTLRLEHDVDLNLSTSSPPTSEQADPVPETLHLTGNSMRFQRDTRRVQMNGDVHAQQSTRELSAGELLLELDGEFHAHRMVASDNPRLRDSGTVGALGLSATEIASSMRPDGSVDSIVATGSVHATRTTPAGDDAIDAGRVEVDLATRQNVPRLLTASNGVALVSTSTDSSGGTRRLETDGLEIHFSDQSHPGEIAMETVNTLAPARVEWRSMTNANGKSFPQTTQMKGKQMVLNFAGENQLRSLVSTGGVEVTRKVADEPEETTASRDLTAKFDGGEWSTIDQTGDVHFHDGPRAGQSQRAHLDHATDTVTLEGSVAFADGTTRTTAQSASFVHSTNTLRADGRVATTELRQSAGGVSNFAQEPAHISADHLAADTSRGRAVYSGKGRLWQGDTVIEAETIELDNPSHRLVAKGHVLGVFPQAAWNPKATQGSAVLSSETEGKSFEAQRKAVPVAPASTHPAPVFGQLGVQTLSPPQTKTPTRPGHPQTQLGRARGELLTYWEPESRARIEQGARVDMGQGSIQADKIDLFFSEAGAANATRQLSRAVATGGVDVRQEDRRGTSDKAEYTASEGKFVLSGGKPTVYSSTGDTATGRQLTFYFADDRIVVESAEGSKTVTLHQVEK
jgi:lipopolysaccharide export system protein LptA